MGRKSDYTKELVLKICERISLGESLRAITKDEDMPSMATVFRWLTEEDKTYFQEQYARAKERQADAYEEMMLETARTEKDVARARLIVDTMKWTASKLKPKKYGDKIDVTSDGERLDSPYKNLTVEELQKLAGK